MREITITRQEEGQRLDRYLSRYLPGASSGFLHKMLRKKNIKRNQEKAAGGEKLAEGDRIQIYFSEDTLVRFGAPALESRSGQKRPESAAPLCRKNRYEASEPPDPKNRYEAAEPLAPKNRIVSPDRIRREEASAGLSRKQRKLRKEVRILFQNEDILILHKPAGMLSQKAAAGDDSLNDYLYDYWMEEIMKGKDIPASFRPSVANRLDRNTSGIVLCGLTVRGLQTLTALLKNRGLEKYYLCLVKGRVTEEKKISGYLLKDEKKNLVSLHTHRVPGSACIKLSYEVLSSTGRMSLLRVRLITGKSHQIRAQLAALGHPILGDPKYGDARFNQEFRKKGICHQLLHSSELIFPQSAPDLPVGLSGLHIIDEMPAIFHIAADPDII